MMEGGMSGALNHIQSCLHLRAGKTRADGCSASANWFKREIADDGYMA